MMMMITDCLMRLREYFEDCWDYGKITGLLLRLFSMCTRFFKVVYPSVIATVLKDKKAYGNKKRSLLNASNSILYTIFKSKNKSKGLLSDIKLLPQKGSYLRYMFREKGSFYHLSYYVFRGTPFDHLLTLTFTL